MVTRRGVPVAAFGVADVGFQQAPGARSTGRFPCLAMRARSPQAQAQRGRPAQFLAVAWPQALAWGEALVAR